MGAECPFQPPPPPPPVSFTYVTQDLISTEEYKNLIQQKLAYGITALFLYMMTCGGGGGALKHDKGPHSTERRPLKDHWKTENWQGLSAVSKISEICCLCGMAPKTPERPLKDQKQLFQQDPRRTLKTAESLLRDQ